MNSDVTAACDSTVIAEMLSPLFSFHKLQFQVALPTGNCSSCAAKPQFQRLWNYRFKRMKLQFQAYETFVSSLWNYSSIPMKPLY